MAEKAHEVCLPNGMIVKCSVVAKVFDDLDALGKINQYILWELIHKCRFPKYQMSARTTRQLEHKGLFHPDGNIKADVQNIILFLAEGQEPSITIISYEEAAKIFVSVEDGKDIE